MFRLLLLAAVVAPWIQAQSGPAFDVASLKAVHSTGDLYNANLGTAVHGEVVLTNATLSDCLRFAYGITNDAQISGPDWIRNKDIRFDILAKASPETPRIQLLIMLQALLNERFHLVLHRELKELSYLALTVAKKRPDRSPGNNTLDDSRRSSMPGRIISNRMSMQLLATLLSRFLRATVIDLTGLQGTYVVQLLWTPESATPVEGDTGPSIFTAVREQLGLKLEARKGPLEVLLVDRADKFPEEN